LENNLYNEVNCLALALFCYIRVTILNDSVTVTLVLFCFLQSTLCVVSLSVCNKMELYYHRVCV